MASEVHHGLTIKPGDGMTRIELGCLHQKGLLYIVPSEKNWVCSQTQMSTHSLAGFLSELTSLGDSRIKGLMQQWGIYYRSLALEEEPKD